MNTSTFEAKNIQVGAKSKGSMHFREFLKIKKILEKVNYENIF